MTTLIVSMTECTRTQAGSQCILSRYHLRSALSGGRTAIRPRLSAVGLLARCQAAGRLSDPAFPPWDFWPGVRRQDGHQTPPFPRGTFGQVSGGRTAIRPRLSPVGLLARCQAAGRPSDPAFPLWDFWPGRLALVTLHFAPPSKCYWVTCSVTSGLIRHFLSVIQFP